MTNIKKQIKISNKETKKEVMIMNELRCPKCGETRLIYIPGKAGVYGTGNNIMTGMTIFSAVLVNRYVCNRCGYSEEWIDP